MTKTIIKIKTWGCADCNYTQDFEPTQELMSLHFNQDDKFKINDIQENECPSCALKGNRRVSMEKIIDENRKCKMTVMGEEDIDAEIVKKDDELTKDGKSKMTNAEKTVYRTKRLGDIQVAITKAREFEDK